MARGEYSQEPPKLPLVFCHGLLGFKQIGPLKYWRGVKQHLKKTGCTVYFVRVPPTSSIEKRAETLKKAILRILEVEEEGGTGNQMNQIFVSSHKEKSPVIVEGVPTSDQSEAVDIGSPSESNSKMETKGNLKRKHSLKRMLLLGPKDVRKEKEEQELPKVTKVHLIAHSMGGLDARYFISKLEGYKYVHSLVTIGTPHRGSSAAETMLNLFRIFRVEPLLRKFGISTDAFHQLTVSCLEKFNEDVKDVPSVKYYSYGGGGKVSFVSPMRLFYRQMLEKEGPNDGLVSVESARWGTFLGSLDVDHMEQMNWHVNPFKNTFFLFEEIVNVLRQSEDSRDE